MSAQRKSSPPPPWSPSPIGDSKLRDLHVLVVDDEEDARDLMAVILERAGAKVKLAESVPDAMRAMSDSDFEVLVSDIGMPGEDGYELIRRLRAGAGSAKSRGIPAVAVTAFTRPEDRRRALDAGFQEHLPKPVDLSTLVNVVARLAATGTGESS